MVRRDRVRLAAEVPCRRQSVVSQTQWIARERTGVQAARENEPRIDHRLRRCRWPNGTVFDPFSGSGTTLHAAMLAGRNGVGFDARQEQTIVALHRLIDVANEVVQDNQVVLINADGIIVSIDKEHGVSTIIGGPIPEIPK
jgi:hypothetical protein